MAEVRRNDYSLSDDQRAVRDSFTEFFVRECPSSRVRDAEPHGFDEKLWRSMAQTGAVTMGLPMELGGGDADLVDLVLVAEQYGRHLAPVPLIEATVALRLLGRSAPEQAGAWIEGAAAGGLFPTLALRPMATDRQLIPAGSVAAAVLGLNGDDLVLAATEKPLPQVRNQGSAPLAWWEASPGTVLATGPRARELYGQAVREWKLLTAAALVGIGDGALQLGLAFVKDRKAFDTPIGAFQAISHALADTYTAVIGARHLTWKAAWFTENEPGRRRELIPMAFAYAAQTAMKAATVGTHVQGGFGFTVESDLQLYFRRAKGWSVLAGDPRAELSAIGRLLADQVRS
ncbi:alkylation response protein AidB-like acyl-CoA dehydrogenase [Streptosporangium album]|uniref:Alkylation response protein AidB-like acyl-CoA dehydrogenase n=1 Tax=Streptosporangium album TaxID=47479 RepID=A0A7W7S5B7_9ACTN|nr:acyl-CoA dehydrogenase family protein [Streptosporangium album]MBB4944165.1 alkylation response protein AidB-like acyl-CoA dehydrogenase [Streptosporangium album]